MVVKHGVYPHSKSTVFILIQKALRLSSFKKHRVYHSISIVFIVLQKQCVYHHSKNTAFVPEGFTPFWSFQ
jgi:hypothetical protein